MYPIKSSVRDKLNRNQMNTTKSDHQVSLIFSVKGKEESGMLELSWEKKRKMRKRDILN